MSSPPSPAVTSETDSAIDSGAIEAFPSAYAQTRRFTVGVPRNITILDRHRVLFLRSRSGDDPALCLWMLELDQGGATERLLVDPVALTLGGSDDRELPAAERARRERARESAGGIVGYAVDRAGRRACFGLAGTLHVIDLDSGRVTMPPVTGPVFDPRLSPDGTKVAYVSGDDLRLVDLESTSDDSDDFELGGRDRALATGGASISWGRADFIAAEEMQRSRGYWWSPTSDRLLVARVDESQVQSWWIADPAHPGRQPTQVRYPAAGTANARVELHVVGLDGSTRRIIWGEPGATDTRFEYLADVVWTGDHRPLLVRQTRNQREVSIASIDLEPDIPTLTERRSVTDDVWVELIPGSPTPCEHGLLTIEDLTPAPTDPEPSAPGRRALMLDGRPLTGPGLNVRSIVRVIDGAVIVTAWTEPSEIHLVAIDLVGEVPPIHLTSEPGVHAAVVGGGSAVGGDGTDADRLDGTPPLIVVTSSTPDRPGSRVTIHHLIEVGGTETERGLALGGTVATIDDVSAPPPIPALPTFCQLGPDRLESALFLPSDYDGSSSLPVLLDPYGGPHAQRVLKHHTPHLVSQWFAEQGFAVLVTDGRGTPGRGPTWERQVWGDLAEPVLADQMEALDAAADEFDILDLDRVGIRGWSFGGYLAALAVLRRPDRFHAAVAGAPVTTWRLYDTHYTERYLGRPDLQPIHYEQTDLLGEAAELSRPLLLIHGLADDNVVAAHTLRLSTALLAAGRPHRVLPLSGVTHMTPQEVVAENLLWIQLDFLRESLGLGSAAANREAAK